MRPIQFAALASLALVTSPASAQVKDSHGNALRVGLPAKPAPDYDGGTIRAGRPAKCVLDSDAPKVCTFYPRNGDGSFAIDVEGMAYYADKVSPGEIIVDYDNGARLVPQGRFTRSKRDPACWVQGSDRKICVY